MNSISAINFRLIFYGQSSGIVFYGHLLFECINLSWHVLKAALHSLLDAMNLALIECRSLKSVDHIV